MGTIKKAAWTAFVIAVALTVAGEVAAQPGPAPGYDDPYAYAVDHAEDEVDSAGGDPAGWGGGKASQEAIDNETRHAAWLACWTADHEADANPAGVCDNYYTQAEAAAPEQPGEAEDPEVADPIDDRLDDAEATVAEVVDAAGGIAEEPFSAPEQVQRIATAVVGFIDRTAKGLVAFVEDLIDLVSEALGVGGDIVASGTSAFGDEVLGSALSVAEAALGAASLGAEAATGAAGGIGDAAGEATGTISEGVGEASEAVAETFGSVVDAVAGWFGGDEPSPLGEQDVPIETPDAGDGLGLPRLEDVVDEVL